MEKPPTILVVDDDPIARLVAAQSLVAAGFSVCEADNGLAGLETIRAEKPAVVVLDHDMPGMNGREMLAAMRDRGDLEPVLMLTVHGQLESRVAGLDAGADDYVVKPCEPTELVARVRALLRRYRAPVETVRILRFGPTLVNLESKTAENAGNPVALTRTEYALLEVLAANIGRPVPREKILEAVWGYPAPTNTHTVETHVWRLRKKLGDDNESANWIVNQKGLGYVMQCETE